MNLPKDHLLQNGKYKLTHVVGQGGFGITYKGVWFTEVKGELGTIKTEVPVCIKEYFFKDYCYRDADSFTIKVHSETGRNLFQKFKEKLIKEARILSDVHHPYIVNVLEVFEENDTAYIAMEYIPGHSLKQLMDKEGVLPEPLVLKYVHQIGEALHFVHQKSILHLDIKPSNILIDNKGDARLIDFGVSKRYDIEQQETSTTMLTLSKGFASIEQYDDEGTQNFSPRPDVYSLGATMYNLLTGIIPTESILRATRSLKRPTKLNPAITPKTEAVIMKSMAIVPFERFPTVKDMLSALDKPAVDEIKVVPPKVEEKPLEEKKSSGDTTIVHKLPPIPKDEQTVLAPVKKEDIPGRKRKSSLILVLLIGFALLASAVTVVWFYNKPVDIAEVVTLPSDETNTPLTPDAIEDTNESITSSSETKDIPNEENAVVLSPSSRQETSASIDEKTANVTESTATKPAVNTEENIRQEKSQPVSSSATVANLDAQYAVFISAGRSKMDIGNYAGAKEDFSKAKDLKLTEEVMRLIFDNDVKAEEKRIADQKAQYEEKMAFGNYMIVRKKSNDRYGAIDADGNERIPCKYLSVGRAENGRAFEREDHLIDIYNSDGVLVSKGVTDY